MKVKTSLYIQLAMLAVTIAIGAYYAQILPDKVPTHWNLQGQIDQYGSKWVSILLGPGMMLFGIILTMALPKISPKNYEIDTFETTFSYVMLCVAALFLYLSIVILKMTAGSHMDIARGMMAGIFLFFAILGNQLGKVRRNFFVGIRTPWTVASEPVWDATHRQASYLWVAGGVVGAALALLGAPIGFSIGLLVAMSLWPVVMSYIYYRRLA